MVELFSLIIMLKLNLKKRKIKRNYHFTLIKISKWFTIKIQLASYNFEPVNGLKKLQISWLVRGSPNLDHLHLRPAPRPQCLPSSPNFSFEIIIRIDIVKALHQENILTIKNKRRIIKICKPNGKLKKKNKKLRKLVTPRGWGFE